MAEDWQRSPQQIDPLSWFTGQRLPLVLGLASLIQAVPTIVAYRDVWSSVWLQVLAAVIFALASLVGAASVRSPQARFGHRHAALMLVLAAAGVVLSAGGMVGGTVRPESWWATLSFAIVVGTLAPYCSLQEITIYAIPSVLVVGAIGVSVYQGTNTYWPIGTVVIICIAPTVTAAAASGVFSYTVVSKTRRAIEHPDRGEVADPLPPTVAVESAVLAQVGARVAPFLRGLAEAGTITDADRALAGELARGLRADLVRVTDSSWLDTLAYQTGFIVNDPQRLGDRMNEAQRATLRALLLAELSTPGVDSGSLLIELRAQPDGSTAVALSLDVDLPEGRRLMFLAPYYLTLGTTVDDLTWTDETGVRLRFQIPPEPRA